MHEVSLATSMIERLNELIKKEQMRTIERITVQIGELSNVMPEALSFAFDCMIQSKSVALDEQSDVYPFENCQMTIERLPARAVCRQCQKVSSITHERKSCFYCQSHDLEILSGYELQISEVEGEEGYVRNTN